MVTTESQPLANEYIREREGPTAAYEAAVEEAAHTGGHILPATMFIQGGRVNLSLAMTLADVADFVHRQTAPRDSDPRASINRPLMPDHARTIERYLVDNGDSYILPSLTLSVKSDLSVYTMKSPSPLRTAWVVMRSDTQFTVTDGQHRLVALTGSTETKSKLEGALRRRPELGGDGVAVHLVFEKDQDRIHQDFADAARTKQIPPSMLAAYNQREPFNRVLAQIARDCPLLAGRVDMMSKTLSKKSQKLFLLNQVRGFLKELILGDYAATEEAVARAAREQLATTEHQQAWIDLALRLLNTLSEHMTPWNEVVTLESGTPAANRIPPLREKYLNMTATGLNIIGRVGHLVFTNVPADAGKQAIYFEKLAKLDWRKSNPDWEGTVILPGTTRLATARSAVNLANRKVRDSLDLPPDW